MKYIWKKPYVGPFNKAEADRLVQDIKKFATPKEHDIYDAVIRKRKSKKTGRNGMPSPIMFDVLIKTTK